MLPPRVKTEQGPDWALYDLPLRPVGAQRIGGVLVLGFWVAFVSVPLEALRSLWRTAGRHSGFIEWGLLAFVSLFLLVSLEPLGLGLSILFGRARLVVLRDRVVVTEIVGPFRWRRTTRFADIKGLELLGRRVTPGRALTGREVRSSGLRCRLKNGKLKWLLTGYPRDWLEEIAAEVSARMNLAGDRPATAEAAGPEPEE